MMNKQRVLWALEELSSREEQERLWLSDGSTGEVSSFEEAVCGLFDASFDSAIASGDLQHTFSIQFCNGIVDLRKAISHFQDELELKHIDTVVEIINHPAMEDIRNICKSLYCEGSRRK